MKESTQNTILVLGGVGILGYFLYKSDFFKGLGQVSTGLGEGVEGIGSGVSSAFTGTGTAISDISGDIAGATENILSLLSPLGALGTSISRNIENTASNKQALKQDVFNESKDILVDIQSTSDINTASEKSLRRAERQDFYSDTQTAAINTIETYNPASVLSNFVQSIKKVVQNINPTGAAVSGGASSSSVRTSKTSASSSVTYSTAAEAAAASPSGLGFAQLTSGGYIPLNTIVLQPKTSKLRQFLQKIF